MTSTDPSPETIDMAAVWADDELLDAATSTEPGDVAMQDAAIAALMGKRTFVDAEPLNPAHGAALEAACVSLFGGAR